MPNLKDIRRRIKSVKSTQKITQAMKMVAAAKVKRAENRVKANRPYAQQLSAVFSEVYESLKNQAQELSGSRYLELLMDRPVKKVGIVLLTSDRGLCGSYNASILKQRRSSNNATARTASNLFFIWSANKAIRAFKSQSSATLLGQIGNISAAPQFVDAQAIAHSLVEAFHAGKIDAIQILYTRFVSMISYKATLQPVFPVKGLIAEMDHLLPPIDERYNDTFKNGTLPTHAETLLAPSPIEVLDALIPLYLGNRFYNALLEASASELAARMTAMSNASNNAAEMIGKLTIQYNKARQASITQEILEIVSGASALG